MTIKEAIDKWAKEAMNTTMANHNRQAIDKVLIKRYGDKDITSVLSKDVARLVIHSSEAPREMKVKAASVLTHVVGYCLYHDFINHPADYTFNDLVQDLGGKDSPPPPEEFGISLPELKPEPAPEPPKPKVKAGRLVAVRKKTGGRATRKVCKLDPKTLKVVTMFDSIKAAAEDAGAKVDNAIRKHQKCHGFYYCYAEEVPTFKTSMQNIREAREIAKDHAAREKKKADLEEFSKKIEEAAKEREKLASQPVEDDNVNHPKHYMSHPSGVECIEITRHYCFAIGNAIKYLWRAGLKSEQGMEDTAKEIQDLEKAVWYINDRIKQLKGEL